MILYSKMHIEEPNINTARPIKDADGYKVGIYLINEVTSYNGLFKSSGWLFSQDEWEDYVIYKSMIKNER